MLTPLGPTIKVPDSHTSSISSSLTLFSSSNSSNSNHPKWNSTWLYPSCWPLLPLWWLPRPAIVIVTANPTARHPAHTATSTIPPPIGPAKVEMLSLNVVQTKRCTWRAKGNASPMRIGNGLLPVVKKLIRNSFWVFLKKSRLYRIAGSEVQLIKL